MQAVREGGGDNRKNSINQEKVLDNYETICYHIKVVRRKPNDRSQQKTSKEMKKVLDKLNEM